MPRTGLLTTRGQTFLVLGAIVLLAGVALGYPDITRVGAVLLLLPLLALLWVSRKPPSIRVGRTVTPALLTPDEVGQVEVEFLNVGTARTPMYLAEEQFDYALGDRPRFLLPRMDRGEHRRLRYQIRSRHRGAYELGPVTLRLRDPFGLTYVALHLMRVTEVLVLPRVFDLGSRVTRGQGRGTEGELPQMVALHGEDDVSIRTWRDGDELRRVHWPATAHRGELMVRQEDRPARRRALLLLDSRAAAHPGTGVRASYEWAVSAIASVAQHLAADGFVVHLLTDATMRDGTAEHPVDLDATLAALARVQPEEDSRLDRIAAAADPFTSGGVLVIAAVVAHDEQDLRALASIRQPGSRALAFVLDPEKFGGPSGDARRGGRASRRGHDDDARPALPGILADAGWRTVTVGPHTDHAQAWTALGAASRVGAR